MDKKLLKDLYGGEIRLGEQIMPTSEEYKALLEELKIEREKIPEEYKNQMNRLLALQLQICGCEVEDALYRGMAFMLKLLQEVDSIEI